MTRLAQIVRALPQNFTGVSESFFYAKTDSTQDLAKHAAQRGAPTGSLWVADAQIRGRGRQSRNWSSPNGLGLYFSLLLRPALPLAQWPLVSLAAGLGLQRTLERLGVAPILLKWPNDLWFQQKKIAGILAELLLPPSPIPPCIVLGVGLNVHQQPEDFPAELRDKAASLAQLHPHPWDRADLLQNLLPEIFHAVEFLVERGAEDLIRAWEQASGTLGHRAQIIEEPENPSGRILGLSPEGYLRLQLDSGEVRHFMAEDVSLIFEAKEKKKGPVCS